jgi:hypothetical protein
VRVCRRRWPGLLSRWVIEVLVVGRADGCAVAGGLFCGGAGMVAAGGALAAVLIRLPQVTGAALREAITDGWLACAHPRLARDFLAG